LASSGEQAIEIAENEKPDIMIMDIGLHGSMDGIEAAGQIKDRFGIPVIYVTGYADDNLKEKAGVDKPHEYLVKPITREDIKSSIEMALKVERISP
jgi:CheY-like chemotaxis protein